jgi:hypothetical protein
MTRSAVVMPLKRGVRRRAEKLLEQGLPFNPEAAGLESYEVVITDDEVVFLFEAPEQHVLDRFAAELSAWTGAVAWKGLAASAPRAAEPAYAWRRRDPQEQLSSAPTPGPGDSDGGDIFAP